MEVAGQYVKFLKIVGSQCIANFPDRLCPTILVYKAVICALVALFPFGC